MLTEAPWAFSATPDDDLALDQRHLAELLADRHKRIYAVADDSWITTTSDGSPHADADLVAVAGIRRMNAPKFSHRAQLWGVFVAQSFRGRGFGRTVVEAAIDAARRWSGVDYVDLGVSENAPEALHLYRRLGFREWGREPATTQVGDRRFDEIYMALKL